MKRKFLILSFIFSLPLICFIGIPSYILWKTGEEFINIDKIILTNDKYLIGYAYDEKNYGYIKWLKVTNQKYKIITLGTSIVLQFRYQMFTSPFYNAGYTIGSIWDFIPFLENISSPPEYLIIGLDQYMFNEAWNKGKKKSDKEKWKNSFSKYPTAITMTRIWKDILCRKYNFSFPSNDKITYIGLNAFVNNKGIHNDGSMYYGSEIHNLLHDDSYRSNLFQDTFDRIEKGINRFEYGDHIDENAIKELEQLLQYCNNRHINLIAFLPPYANTVFENMDKSGKYNYIMEIYARSKPIFDSYGFELYDFSTVESCNSNDNEVIDGFHGGEVTYLKMLIEMINSGSILKNVVDIDSLTNDLLKKINNYQVYND
jgi:hypothetical protein